MAGRGIEMTTDTLTLYEIRTVGFEALLRELGPAGAIRFIQQYESGHGDYTRNRKKLLPKKSVREIGKQIMKQRQHKQKEQAALVKNEGFSFLCWLLT
jgi:hypothetical protein